MGLSEIKVHFQFALSTLFARAENLLMVARLPSSK